MRRLSKKARVDTLRRVARHIRRWPHLFDFWVTEIPKRGKTCPACALGRAGVILGAKSGEDLNSIAKALGFGDTDAEWSFYVRVRAAMTARSGYCRGMNSAPASNVAQAIEDVAAAL